MKPAEIIWAVVQGVAAYVVTVVQSPIDWTDWRAFAIAAAAAGARAAVAVVFGRKPEAAG